MKINNFRGDFTDISAIMKALIGFIAYITKLQSCNSRPLLLHFGTFNQSRGHCSTQSSDFYSAFRERSKHGVLVKCFPPAYEVQGYNPVSCTLHRSLASRFHVKFCPEILESSAIVALTLTTTELERKGDIPGKKQKSNNNKSTAFLSTTTPL